MSGLDSVPDEKPYIYLLEEKLSSLSLFISDETKKKIVKLLNKNMNFSFFKNPAPVELCQTSYKINKKINKILVVSNHPPDELLEACKILSFQKISTTFFGEKGDRYEIITKDILSQYDVIITIGKTVQYCLVMGIPVYIYDHFGGSGYLNNQNFTKAMKSNFSGRENQKHNADFIAKDIINRFNESIIWTQTNHQEMIKKFSIKEVLPPILNKVKQKKLKPFDKKYTEMLINTQIFAQNRFVVGGYNWIESRKNESLNKENKELELSLNKKNEEIISLKHIINKYKIENRKYLILKDNFKKILESKTYKLGCFLTWPIYRLKKLKH